MTYDYTYAIGTDTAPVEINVKPYDSVSLNVEGELASGQVFVDKTSAADVSIKAKSRSWWLWILYLQKNCCRFRKNNNKRNK